jgi:hypothetical protein
MTIHELKCWPEQFAALRDGIKSFELRMNDRDYRVGDTLRLREWYPDDERYDDDKDAGEYTGRSVDAEVTYMIEGACLMSIEITATVMAEGDVPFGYQESEG